jgi:tetratricopeptide (TPR) repeat protein/Holliday junction resolvase
MSLQAVDWGRFSGSDGGHRFERFCADLLAAQGFAVEHMSKGGNDEGKDLLILQHPKDIIGPPPTVQCIVECKSRTSKNRRAISLEDINRSLWALFETNSTCLVVFTTHKFNSQAVNCFLRLNERGRVKISWIDQDDLVELGRRHPEVWRVHLGTDPPPRLSSETESESYIRADGQARRILWGTDEPVTVIVHNSGPSAGRAMLRKNGIVVTECALGHHQRAILHAPSADNWSGNPYDELTVSFEPADATSPVHEQPVRGVADTEKRQRIDCLFADPENQRQRILKSLASGSDIHIRGDAGCGKTRLLDECLRQLPESLFADLSRDDEHECLLASLVQHLTGWPPAFLASLPEGLVGKFSDYTECDERPLQIVADFCAGRRAHTAAAVACALIALASRDLMYLIVDNIQDATMLDEAILQEAVSAARGPTCLVATRTEEGNLPTQSAAILRAMPQRPIEFPQNEGAAERIAEFIRIAATDEATAVCLEHLVGSESFQGCMSRLKALRQLGALHVDEGGSLRLVEEPERTDFGTYAQVQNLVLYSRLAADLREPCTNAVRAAAVFGETFPVAFIEAMLGDRGVEALDELERRELIVSVTDPSPYGLCFRFDHALTRNAIIGTTPTTKRVSLHREAARFIESWVDFQPGSSHYEAAAHYSAAGCVADALAGYETGSRHFLQIGRIGSAQRGLLEGLPLFDLLPLERTSESIARELQDRELLLETALLVPLPEDVWRQQIDAFQIQAHLFPGIPDFTRRIGRSYCFNACFAGFRRHVPSGWREMERALKMLSGIEDPLPFAEAQKWGANLQKNLGRYEEAAIMARRAYDTYAKQHDERHAGEAATELSHVFYEAYKFADAYKWGELALQHYGVVGHPSLVARARVDIARLLAINRPGDPATHEELELSVRLGRHAGIGSLVAKALMNLGIYLAIEDSDLDQAAERFADAERVLHTHPNSYVETLLGFARIGLFAREEVSEELAASLVGERTLELCRYFDKPDQIGDRRLQMILKVLSAAGNPAVLGWLEAFSTNQFTPYARIGLGKDFYTLERTDPFFRQGGFALYY